MNKFETRFKKLSDKIDPEKLIHFEVIFTEERDGKTYNVKTGEVVPDDPNTIHVRPKYDFSEAIINKIYGETK